MTCIPPCKFEFCWLCLCNWAEHGEKSWDRFHKCYEYEENIINGVSNEEDSRRRLAKTYMEKYTHYYKPWESNHISREKAIQDLKKMKREKLENLSNILDKPKTEFEFILKGLEQIIECRRVLKWSYVYGYYLPDDQPRKRAFFNYIQGEAEAKLEQLNNCAEQELSDFFEAEKIMFVSVRYPNSNCVHYFSKTLTKKEEMEKKMKKAVKFYEFREKFSCLTEVTASCFETSAIDLEKGLPEFEVEGGSSEGGAVSCGDKDGLNKSDYWGCVVYVTLPIQIHLKCVGCATWESP